VTGEPPTGSVAVGRLSSPSVDPLRHALYEAAFWREGPRPPLDEVLSHPRVAVYIEGWGRSGDTAVVARDSTGAIGGAAWFRFFTEASHGYGFINDAVPEVTIGLDELWRGLGIGTRLITALHTEARASGIARLSLSVEHDNRALRLYQRLGYGELTRDNGAVTMLAELEQA
jgi:ribosomal protein S18 acetylase RimI-like enzyme